MPISSHFRDCKSALGHAPSCKQRYIKYRTFIFTRDCQPFTPRRVLVGDCALLALKPQTQNCLCINTAFYALEQSETDSRFVKKVIVTRDLADIVETPMIPHCSNYIKSTQCFCSTGSHLLLQFTNTQTDKTTHQSITLKFIWLLALGAATTQRRCSVYYTGYQYTSASISRLSHLFIGRYPEILRHT